MYKFVVGNISSQRRENWFCNDGNPYAVWEGAALLERACYVGSWCIANDYLRDRVDVDWGSIAWKGTPQEISALFSACNLQTDGLEQLRENTDYAVVFIETVWGDSA